MTGSTIVYDAGMIEHRAGKAPGGMTNTTVLISLRMIICFTYGECTIMTRLVVIHDSGMIKGPRYKARGLVAHAAILSCWHMIRWRCFSSGGCTIMA